MAELNSISFSHHQDKNGDASLEDAYEMLELVGEGAYGQVYKAREIKTGKICAVKIIKNIFRSVYEA